MEKQINYGNHQVKLKTEDSQPGDGDPWAPNNLLKSEAKKKKKKSTPVCQATDKKLLPQPTNSHLKVNSFKSESS